MVIIDEIDGASNADSDGQSFIKLLVQLVQSSDAPKPASSKDADKTSNKKKDSTRLLRPIICICNDLWAPILRPLLGVAQSCVVRPPPYQALSKRLCEISEWEGLHSDLRAMMALCEMTQGDMRSCINTLQFIKRKTNKLTKESLMEVDIGSKDFSKNLFKLWSDIFTISSAKSTKRALLSNKTLNTEEDTHITLDQNASGDDVRYVERLVHLIQNSGDYGKIMEGLNCQISS